MKSELQNKLYERFPKMFRGKDKSIQESAMPWGVECGNGWFDVLWRLCEDIEKLNPPEEFEVTQVKEKFGSLRFYTWSSTDEIEDRIEKAERESGKTCEWCGKFGKRRDKGWIVTMCNGCYEEYLDGKRR
jgi:hypothetical protein